MARGEGAFDKNEDGSYVNRGFQLGAGRGALTGGASAEGGEGEEDGAAEQDRRREGRGKAPQGLKAAPVGGVGLGLVGVHGERPTVVTSGRKATVQSRSR